MAIRIPKHRVLASAAIVLIGASTLLCRMTLPRPSLEAVLNLLWLGLALGSFTAWIRRPSPAPRSRSLELLALVAAFALLFPVISPADDLAQPFENDACTTQLVVSGLRAEKHLAAAAGLTASVVPPFAFLPAQQRRVESVSICATKLLPSVSQHASGNHSPPQP